MDGCSIRWMMAVVVVEWTGEGGQSLAGGSSFGKGWKKRIARLGAGLGDDCVLARAGVQPMRGRHPQAQCPPLPLPPSTGTTTTTTTTTSTRHAAPTTAHA